MVTCGGQATIPMVHAVSRVVDVDYAEIVATVSSSSAGPGTRQNIDEFTRTTSKAVEVIGGAPTGKAIIILNPAEPPLIMRDTIFCSIPAMPTPKRSTSRSDEMAAEVATYVPGYRLDRRPPVRRAVRDETRSGRHLRRGRGRGRLPAPVRRQPRHDDRGRHEGRQRDRRPDSDSQHRWQEKLPCPTPTLSTSESPTPACATAPTPSATSSPRTTFVRSSPALDDAGMPVIEVTHGDGLGGSRTTTASRSPTSASLMKAAVETATRAKIAALMLPGLGTKDDIRAIHDLGVSHHPESPPTAPRPTSPSSTSRWPASSGSRRSAS